jgi:tetratricopeptide (TPR) repeat protein
MVNQSTMPPDAREPSRPSGDATTWLSEAILETWRRAVDRLGSGCVHRLSDEGGTNALYFRARASARAGDLETAAQQFADLAEMVPTLTAALEGHGEVADRLGQSALARAKYDVVRRLRSAVRRGAPDRPFVLRNRGPFPAEIAAYTLVLQSVKERALPYVARGNALLAEGRARLALLDYGCALSLKPDLHEITALKAEALVMLGRYEEALAAFNTALAARPNDAEIYSGRAIACLALGRLGAADADWRRQSELLPPERASAGACVSLRMADYEAALPLLQRALEKEPGDPYWRLYRLTSLHRLGRTAGQPGLEGMADDAWPGPLLALHAGRLSADDVLTRADNEGRRAEALFQLGIIAWPHDREEARRRWEEVSAGASPALIEHAAARHELARAGS